MLILLHHIAPKSRLNSFCCGSKLQDDLEALDPGNNLYLIIYF